MIAGVDGVPGGWVVARVAGGHVTWSVVGSRRRRAGGDGGVRGGRRRHPARPARRRGAAGLRRRVRAPPRPGAVVGVPRPAAAGARGDDARGGVRGRAPADRAGDQPADLPHRPEDPRVGRRRRCPTTSSRCIRRCRCARWRPTSGSRRRRRPAAPGSGSRRSAAGSTSADALGDLPSGARLDDVLDALAAAWSAQRWAAGTAEVLGEEVDDRGRPMRVVV